MEEQSKLIESLLEKAKDYGKTSIELAKLQALDKTAEVVSSFVPHAFVICLLSIFLFFINFGLALWLGELLEKIWYGFFIVGGFYCIVAIAVRLFLHKRLKMFFNDYIINRVLNK